MKFTSECELAKLVVEWLQGQLWEVYQEVKVGPKVADIVAVQGGLVRIVECKRSASLAVLEQATHWKPYAHYVSVAVPSYGKFFSDLCLRDGIGILEVRSQSLLVAGIQATLPALNRRANTDQVRSSLCEEQKSSKAGSAGGSHWTPFKATCREIERRVKQAPGLPLKELLDNKYHYNTMASARALIPQWIKKGIVPGVRAERDGRFLRIYPEGETK